MGNGDGSEERFRSRMASNLATWHLPYRWAIALSVAPLVVVAGLVVLALTDQPRFLALTIEDGFVEWAQVGVLLVASGAYLMIARGMWKAGMRPATGVALIGAIGAFVIAGEEISWGQRLLGWATPVVLEAINTQGETNIHNITTFATASRLVRFGAAGYGAVLPVLALLPLVSTRLRDSYFLPPVALVPFFLGPFLYWAARIPAEEGRAFFRASEIMELSFYAGLALFALLSLRRWNAQRELATGAT
jgi:hypothetical protein